MSSQSENPLHSVVIIGAGFAGLTLAYELIKKNIKVTVIEKNINVGGMLQTSEQSNFLVEHSANGLMFNEDIKKIFEDLNLNYVEASQQSNKKYFFTNGKVTRWPLTLMQTLQLAYAMLVIFFKGFKNIKPKPNETIDSWGKKYLTSAFVDSVLNIGLQGIYAIPATQLSASLVLGRFFKADRPKFKGTVAPVNGMSQLAEALKKKLLDHGVVFKTEKVSTLLANEGVTVCALPAYALAEITELKSLHFEKINYSTLARVTLSLKNPKKKIEGFGLLVDPKLNLKTKGVLANSVIFKNQKTNNEDIYNESWILGFTNAEELAKYSDIEIINLIQKERNIIFQVEDVVSESRIVRWPKAFPKYDLDLENWLNQNLNDRINLENKKIFFTGNYLGQIGLSQIYYYNVALAKKIQESLYAR